MHEYRRVPIYIVYFLEVSQKSKTRLLTNRNKEDRLLANNSNIEMVTFESCKSERRHNGVLNVEK